MWPVSFPYGMKMHLGTGWYCWKKQQKEDEPVEETIAGDLIEILAVSVKKSYNCQELLQKAKLLFEVYAREKKSKQLLSFLQKQLKYERGDVVKGFLRFLAQKKEPAVTSILKKLTVTPEWLFYATRILKTDKPENITS